MIDIRLVTAVLVLAPLAAQLNSCEPEPPPPPLYTHVYVVNSAGDQPDASDSDGLCLTEVGTCTLRAAMGEYRHRWDATAGIEFAIPGSGPHTIALGSALPIINDPTVPLTIDGYTQPGAQPNTDTYASNANIQIHLRGTTESSSGFTPILVSSSDNVIKGLAITRGFKKIKAVGPDAVRNRFSGLFLGTDPSGTYGATSQTIYSQGIELAVGASHNVIGGPELADRNVVSGNAGHGIALYDDGTSHNVISNNIVGLNPRGTGSLPNRVEGIDLNQNAHDNIVGGWGPNDHNVVSGNRTGGIETSHLQPGLGVRNNSIIGNWVGTTIDGNSRANYTSNGNHGIVIQDGSRDNLVEGNIIGNNPVGIHIDPMGPGHEVQNNIITGNSIGLSRNGTPIPNTGHGMLLEDLSIGNRIEANTIAFNNGRAIVFNAGWGSAVGNTFSRNSIYSNGGSPAIDLPPLGVVNQNDEGDADAGPNTLLNHPVVTTADTTLISGTACAGCRVEVFDVGPDGSPMVHGPGRTFLAEAVADGAGDWTALLAGQVSAGMVLTTTATDPGGSTSEFSRNVAVEVAPNRPPVALATVECVGPHCSFDGSGSSDVDGTITTYTWEFSDGANGSGQVIDHTFTIDGASTATLTVVDDQGEEASITIDVPATPLFEDPVAGDSFSRSSASGWGAADLGGSWEYPAGQLSSFSVDGTSGAVQIPSPGLQRQAALTSTAEVDVAASVLVTPETEITGGFGITSSIQLRRVAPNTEYRARVRFAPGGTVHLAVTRTSGSSSETLVAGEVLVPELSWAPGHPVAIEAQLWGSSPTTLRVRAWDPSGATPTSWHLEASDATAALQGPGAVGLFTYVGSGSTTGATLVRYDDFAVLRRTGAP